MKLLGLMLARNESNIIGYTARIAMSWCDELLVYAHACTDDTAQIARDAGAIVKELPDTGVWDEMDIRQQMLEHGRELGATHFALIDADEWLTANIRNIRYMINSLEPGHLIRVPMVPAWRSMKQYRSDPCVWTNRNDLSLAFSDVSCIHWKATGGYQHHRRHPFGLLGIDTADMSFRDGGVVHAQWWDWHRVNCKHHWYMAVERLRWPNREDAATIMTKYGQGTEETGLELTDMPESWWKNYEPWETYLSEDENPWFLDDLRKMFKDNGMEPFEGISFERIKQWL